MISAAIVEDEKEAAEQLRLFIERYGKKCGETFNITYFADAIELLENYRPVYDILFMDIMMPDLDGMAAAEKIRQTDSAVTIVFVTNMAQYAVKGYDVGASAFIVKPLSYFDFEMKMKRVVFAVRNKDDRVLVVPKGSGSMRLPIRDLAYVEVSGHRCRYHLTGGVEEGYNSIKALAEKLRQYDFMFCNNCYLVNPCHIRNVGGYTLKVGEDELQISHPRKKIFMQQFNEWVAKGGGGNFK